MEKVSYALGLSIGNNLIGSGINDVNLEKFVQGVKDVLEKTKPEISYDEAKNVLDTIRALTAWLRARAPIDTTSTLFPSFNVFTIAPASLFGWVVALTLNCAVFSISCRLL